MCLHIDQNYNGYLRYLVMLCIYHFSTRGHNFRPQGVATFGVNDTFSIDDKMTPLAVEN